MPTLKEILAEAVEFMNASQGEPRLVVENTVLHPLRALAFQAAAVGVEDTETQMLYLKTVEQLRDICIGLGHSNTLKEEPLYRRIQRHFPEFVNPLVPK